MHHHENAQERLPPSRRGGWLPTWAVLLMPYIEQDNLYRQWNVSAPYYSHGPVARETPVKLYFCPSRRAASGPPSVSVFGDVPSDGTSTVHVPGALGDYAVVIDRSGKDEVTETSPEMRGAFQSRTGLRLNDFPDGTSNTLLIGEKHVPQGKEGTGWWDCSVYNGDYYQCSTRAAARAFPLTTNPYDTGWKFGSRHPGVVMFCFADGHVQRVSETIDPGVLELLGMRNDGQVIPDF